MSGCEIIAYCFCASECPFLRRVRNLQCLSAEVSEQSQFNTCNLISTNPQEITRQLLSEAETGWSLHHCWAALVVETARGLSAECVEVKTPWS